MPQSSRNWRDFQQRRANALQVQNGRMQPQHQQYNYDNQGYSQEETPSYSPSPGFRNHSTDPYIVVDRFRKSPHHQPAPVQYAYAHRNYNDNQGSVDASKDFEQAGSVVDDSSYNSGDNPFNKRRKCRDVICLGLFAGFAIVTIVVIGYAGSKGDYNRIFAVEDTIGCNLCGENNMPIAKVLESGKDMSALPYALRSTNNYNESVSKAQDILVTCVRECPPNYLISKTRQICYPDPTLAQNVTVTNRSKQTVFQSIGAEFDDFSAQFAIDLEETWVDMIWICLIALGVSIVMLVLLRFLAGVIIWAIVVTLSIACVAGSAALWGLYFTKDDDSGNNTSLSKNELLIFAIIVSVITLLVLVVFLVMRKRIALVVRLFKEAGKAVASMPLILFQPLMTFAALAMAYGAWFSVALLIETAGDCEQQDEVGVAGIQKSKWILFSRWWNIVAIIWMTQFIIACQHLVIAGAIATWFFTRNKARLGWPVLNSLRNLVRYHLGSVAFGSLIIAVVKVIRLILKTIEKRLGGSNILCKSLMCCCKCATWCLEKFLVFLNRNAYIEIAIYGYGFCKSARKAFSAIVNNALRMAAINSLGDFVLFLSKLAIVGVTVGIGYYLLKDRNDVHHIWVPLVIGAFFAYFIAHCFISVYEMAIDTIFICFCEDCSQNDGDQKPYYMSRGLMEFVKHSEKALKSKNKKGQ